VAEATVLEMERRMGFLPRGWFDAAAVDPFTSTALPSSVPETPVWYTSPLHFPRVSAVSAGRAVRAGEAGAG
jgi:hypothetical protein